MITISGLQGQAPTPAKWRETNDLRKQRIAVPTRGRIMQAHTGALLWPYDHPTDTTKQTTGLEPGTQAKLISAAFSALEKNCPINTLLSARWHSLLTYDDFHPLRTMSASERVRHLVEKIRHWLSRRGIPAHYIWVREISDMAGEHWHLGLHLPRSKRKWFAGYLETILLEPLAPCPRAESKQTRGEFECSEMGSWHLAGEVPDGKPHFTGYWIAAYLGKGEPSQRMFRGNLADNALKPVRGREFGGYVNGGRYDVPQGHIEGTTTRKGRFDIARCLK